MLDSHDVLSLVPLLPDAECPTWIGRLEARGFQATGLQYPPDYRDNDRLVFDDPALAQEWAQRLHAHLPSTLRHQGRTWSRVGLNPRFRACRYREGQRFAVHRDGPWVPTERRRSLLTVMLYLAEPERYEGGETRFWSTSDRQQPEGVFRPAAGQALVFAHSRWHEGRPVTAGTKWVLRTDVLYEVDGAAAEGGYLWDVTMHLGMPAVSARDGTVRHRDRTLFGDGSSILRLLSLDDGLLGGDRQGRLFHWPDSGRPPQRWDAHEGAVLSLRRAPDGVWSTGADGVARRWRGSRLVEERRGDGWLWDLLPDGDAPRMARDPVRVLLRFQGRTVSGRSDGRIEVEGQSWSAHQGAVRALAGSACGLVSGGEDGAVRLWSAGGPIELHRHEDFVTGLALDGDRVWSTGYDGRLLASDLAKRRRVA